MYDHSPYSEPSGDGNREYRPSVIFDDDYCASCHTHKNLVIHGVWILCTECERKHENEEY